jgi:hypothetical protein
MTKEETIDLMTKMLDERQLHDLEFDWEEIASLPKPLAAMIIGLEIIENNLYSGCSENHFHVYIFTPTPRTESDSDEATQIFH